MNHPHLKLSGDVLEPVGWDLDMSVNLPVPELQSLKAPFRGPTERQRRLVLAHQGNGCWPILDGQLDARPEF